MKSTLLYFVLLFNFYSLTAQNPVAYYPFNGNANDESGNSHNGTVFGATTTSDRLGNTNSAYYFDGIDDYIDIGDWENGGPMTITFWARWDDFKLYSRIIDFGNGPSNNNIIIANYKSQNDLFFSNYIGGTESKMWTPTITISHWDFYSATVDGSGIMTLYKNGVQIAQKTNGYIPTYLLRTEQFIGKSNFEADGYFKGAIDDLRIFGSALSESDILNLYNNSTLKIEKTDTHEESLFYANNYTLYHKNTQHLSEIRSIEVYNVLGQKVFETSTIESEIKLSNLKNGLYVLKVYIINKQHQTIKIYIH